MTPVGTVARRPEAVRRSSAVGCPPRGRARRESAGTDAVLPWESTRLEHTSTVHVPGVTSLVASPKALLSVGSEAQASRTPARKDVWRRLKRKILGCRR